METDEIMEEAERFEKADTQALKSNTELSKVFKAHEENLRQLGRPVLELQKSLPAIPSDGGILGSDGETHLPPTYI